MMKTILCTTVALLPMLAFSTAASAQNAETEYNQRNTYSYGTPADATPAAGEATETVNTTTTVRKTTYDASGEMEPVTTTSDSHRTRTLSVPVEASPNDGMDFVPTYGGLERDANGVAYATGGVGDEEKAQLKSLSGKYNTQILTVASTGAFIGDYTVSIANSKGETVFEAAGDGPYVYVNLPAGTYNVTVTRASNSDSKKQRVVIGKGTKSLKFSFAGE